MRFNIAWAETLAQNVTLKVAVVSLAVVSVSLTLITSRLAFKKPLVIERACLTRNASISDSAPTLTEIEALVREAVPLRFNSDAVPRADYLSDPELGARTREQKDLGSRGMTQVVFVRGVKIDRSTVTIDADRLIAVSQIRSALRFPLIGTIATTTRTESNPYGLQFVKIEQVKQEGEK